MNNNSTSVFLEDLLIDKTSIGSAPIFDKRSILWKENYEGIFGMHAARAFKAEEIIIYIERDGSLNRFRAFEETLEHLAALGVEKYFLGDTEILALAVYKRYINNSQKDILFSTVDLKSSYSNTPMRVSRRVEFIDFIDPNNKKARLEAQSLENTVRKIGLDLDLFYQSLAYVISRSWAGNGLFPGLDLFNARHRGAANAYFKGICHRFCFIADRDISPGEEITWNYNSGGAISAFTNFGYLDPKRLFECVIEVGIEPDDFEKFIDLHVNRFGCLASNFRQNDKDYFDFRKYEIKLSCPGNQVDPKDKFGQLASSIESFFNLRRLVRAKFICKEGLDPNLFSANELGANICSYGIDFEVRCIEFLLDALVQSRRNFSERGKKFQEGMLGPLCDIQPIYDVYNHAYGTWERCLTLIKKMLVVTSVEEASLVIANELGQKIDGDMLRSFLEQSLIQSPKLDLVFARYILKEKQLV